MGTNGRLFQTKWLFRWLLQSRRSRAPLTSGSTDRPWQTASKAWILGAWKGDELNCNERDELFNSIFTTASISFGVGAFCFGLLADRFGIFVGRLTSFSFVSVGLSVLILILKRIIPEVRISYNQFHFVLTQFYPHGPFSVTPDRLFQDPWIWIAWPCLTIGGMANHTLNIRFCRSAPPIAAFLMALTSGCLVAGGSLVLMFQRISEGTGTSFPDVFVILIICYGYEFLIHIIWAIWYLIWIFSVNSLITITIFTPHTIPSDGINLIKESVFLNLFCKKNQSLDEDLDEEPVKNEADEEKSEEPTGSMLDIFKDKNIWLLLLASCAWELRRNTHQGWLAAGWPQWVAAGDENIEDGDQFDYDINRFQSIAFFCLIGGNLIPGILIDTMNKRLTRFESLKGLGRFRRPVQTCVRHTDWHFNFQIERPKLWPRGGDTDTIMHKCVVFYVTKYSSSFSKWNLCLCWCCTSYLGPDVECLFQSNVLYLIPTEILWIDLWFWYTWAASISVP